MDGKLKVKINFFMTFFYIIVFKTCVTIISHNIKKVIILILEVDTASRFFNWEIMGSEDN